MVGERTIMPSAARLRRGWRAGLRAQSGWLDAAAGLAAVGLVLGAIPWSMASAWGTRWQVAMVQPDQTTTVLTEAAWGAGVLGLALCLAFGAARVLSAAFAGRVGIVDRSRRAQLRAGPARAAGTSMALLSIFGVFGMVLALRGVVAGAARSVDATAGGVWQLWTTWPERAWVSALVVLGLVGWVELALSRRRLAAALAQTPEQARDDLKARSGGRL